MKPFLLNLKTPSFFSSANPITVHANAKGEVRVLDYPTARWARVTPEEKIYDTICDFLPADLRTRLSEAVDVPPVLTPASVVSRATSHQPQTPPPPPPNLTAQTWKVGTLEPSVAAANKVGPAPTQHTFVTKGGRKFTHAKYFGRDGQPINLQEYKRSIVEIATGGVMLNPVEAKAYLSDRVRLPRKSITKGASYLRIRHPNALAKRPR